MLHCQTGFLCDVSLVYVLIMCLCGYVESVESGVIELMCCIRYRFSRIGRVCPGRQIWRGFMFPHLKTVPGVYVLKSWRV